ncbi:hypothetical protein IAD21_01932 [Abditibacteriota bacterium]|nr:hypothetical protein IAD21_01932 [Abditibacteriota bacterium]
MTREEYEAKKQTLLTEVERVFEGVERDEKVTQSLKDITSHQIRDEDRALLLNAGKRWQDVPDKWIQEARTSLLIDVDAHGFRFYLPAYLSWFLRFMDYEGSYFPFSSSAFRCVLCILMVDTEMHDYRLKKFSLLDSEQKKIIAQFLVFQCERCIFHFEQDEMKDPLLEPEFLGYRESLGYKNTYLLYRRTLYSHWQQFLEVDLVRADFPYTASSRRWKSMWKVPEQQKVKAYEAKKEALIAEIERAFDGIKRGDGTTLNEAYVIDDYGEAEEQAQARLLDTDTRWQDVTNVGGGSMWTLSMMDANGFRYYLPAFLIWCLHFTDCEEEDFYSETFDGVDFMLGIRSYDAKGFILEEKFRIFDEEQKRAIAHFVQFRFEQLDFRDERLNFSRPLIKNEDDEGDENDVDEEENNFEEKYSIRKDIQRALDTYWGQFL